MSRLDSQPTRAVNLPLEAPYRFIEQGEPYKAGDYIRTNWLGAYYELGAKRTPTDHTGDDVVQFRSVIKGDPLYAIADGFINYSHDVGVIAWGWLVTLDFRSPVDITVTELDRKNLSKTTRNILLEGTPLTARYAHMDTVIVEPGQYVHAGQLIGTVGDAHGMFAPHLHFDICYTDLLDSWPREWPGLDLTTIALNYLAPGEFLRDYAGWRAEPMAVTKRTVNAGIPAHKSFYNSSPVMRVFVDGTTIDVDDASGVLDPETGITMVQCPVDNWIPAALVGLPEITPPAPPIPPAGAVTRYVNTSGLNVRGSAALDANGNPTGAILSGPTIPLAKGTSIQVILGTVKVGPAGHMMDQVISPVQGYVADWLLSVTRP